MTGPTPFADLNDVLADLVASLREVLGDELVGAYLQGSFAVGDADEHSDVDFVVVTRGEVGADAEAALRSMHQRIYARPEPWAQHLEGSYVPAGELRHVDPERKPYLYLDNGATELERSDHCNTAVVRWSLRERGVVLHGPDPKTLVEPVTPAQLAADIAAVLDEWVEFAYVSQERLERPGLPKPAMSRWRQALLVLSFCRMLHTLETGEVTSKKQAGEWGLRALGPRWRDLVQRALDDRPDPWGRVHQVADPDVVVRTIEFVDEMAATIRARTAPPRA